MTKLFYKQLGAKLYKLRKELKLSREKFAEKAGINEYYLGEIERAEKKASLDVLFKICKVLNLKLHEFLNID